MLLNFADLLSTAFLVIEIAIERADYEYDPDSDSDPE
jgi:hypothetical protein